jgi:hypothetical protein
MLFRRPLNYQQNQQQQAGAQSQPMGLKAQWVLLWVLTAVSMFCLKLIRIVFSGYLTFFPCS